VEHLNQGGGIAAAAADVPADGRLNAPNSPIADLV
jgi:hypothetical protein